MERLCDIENSGNYVAFSPEFSNGQSSRTKFLNAPRIKSRILDVLKTSNTINRIVHNDTEFGRLSFSLRRIVGETLPRIRDWTQEQKRIIWDKMVNYFFIRREELPGEMRIFTDSKSKLELAYDETFWSDISVPYCNIDLYWNDIRAAVALWHYDKLTSIKN